MIGVPVGAVVGMLVTLPAVGAVEPGAAGCGALALPLAIGDAVWAVVDVAVAVGVALAVVVEGAVGVLVAVGVEVGVGLIQLTGQCTQIRVAV
jgi:hypothetical protein